MKLTIERDKAHAAVQRAHAVAQRKGTIPILSNLMLAADRATLTVVGTDLDLEGASCAEARVEETGSVTVPAQTLLDILRNTPQGADIGLSLDGASQRLVVRAGRSRFQLPTLPATDFPVFSPPEAAARVVLEAQTLRRLIDRTSFAIAGEKELRTYLQSLALDVVTSEGGCFLRASATDGGRLASAWVACPPGLEGAKRTMLGRKSVAELRALCEEGDEPVEIAFGESLLEAKRGGHRLTSKLIDGTYPEIERVIPRGACPPVRLDAKLLVSGLRRASIMATGVSSGGVSRAVKFLLEPGQLTLEARNSEGGHAEEPIEVAYDGPSLQLSYNATYMLDVLGLMAGAVELEVRGRNDPTKILDPADPACVFIVMPLKI